ncbi:hypothetical protein ABIA96_001580 [Bradyrhizobium sp. LB11.1]
MKNKKDAGKAKVNPAAGSRRPLLRGGFPASSAA